MTTDTQNTVALWKTVNGLRDDVNRALGRPQSYDISGSINVKAYGAKGDGATDDTAALLAAWATVTDGSVLEIPPGTYLVSDTVAWINHDNVTIRGNKAVIQTKTGVNFAGKALVNMAGMNYGHIYDLRINSTLAANRPQVGLCLARVDAGDGAFNFFEGCLVSGLYNFATVYNVDSECNTFLHSYLQSETVYPAYYVSTHDDAGIGVRDDITSCVCHRFLSCMLVNYSAVAGQKIVVANKVIKEISFRDTYFGLGAAGRVISLEGTTSSMYGLFIDNCRVEGPNAANSRLVYSGQDNPCTNMTVINPNWSLVSDYIFEAATVGFTYSFINITNFAVGSKILKVSADCAYNVIIGQSDAMIDVDGGKNFDANHVIWFGSGSPFTGAGYYGAYNRDDNTLLRHYDYNTENSGAVNRRYGKAIGSGATPDVSGTNLINLTYGAGTTITNFINAVPGQEITLVAQTANATIQQNGNIYLAGTANWTMPTYATLTLVYYGNLSRWYEKSRMVP